MVKAIQLDPSSMQLREEYKILMDLKNVKEKEWYSKMNGFFNSTKMTQLQKNEEEEELLK